MCAKIAVKSKVFSSFLILVYRNGKKESRFWEKLLENGKLLGKGLKKIRKRGL